MATMIWHDALRDAQLLVDDLHELHGEEAFDNARARLNEALAAHRAAEADLLAAACFVLLQDQRRKAAAA